MRKFLFHFLLLLLIGVAGGAAIYVVAFWMLGGLTGSVAVGVFASVCLSAIAILWSFREFIQCTEAALAVAVMIGAAAAALNRVWGQEAALAGAAVFAVAALVFLVLFVCKRST